MELAGLEQQLRKLLFQTGAFTTAWSWVLVYYGTWHLLAGESPLQGQAGLGAHAEREGMLLLIAPYLAVCASAAVLLTQLKAAPGPMTGAIVAAVEFFPSPIFTATLLAFLGRFSSGFALSIWNLGISWAVAFVVHLLPTTGCAGKVGDVVRKTVGFGLGVAWNNLFSRAAPEGYQIMASTIYLGIVVLLAAHLAAPEPRADATLRSRHAAMMCFASRVVCAFSLSGWLSKVMPLSGLLGDVCSLVLLLLLGAVLSGWLARADLEGGGPAWAEERAQKHDWGSCLLRVLIFVPCVWCCCPWIPVLWLFAGSGPGVKDRWLSLATTVCALAASVVATNLITGSIDMLAAAGGICDAQTCNALSFLAFEGAAAAVVSYVLLQGISEIDDTPKVAMPARLDEHLLPPAPSAPP